MYYLLYLDNCTWITLVCFGNVWLKNTLYITEAQLIRKSVECTHIDDHADSGESSSQVLWVGRPHRHRDDPRIETAIEGSYQVNTCRNKRQTRTMSTETQANQTYTFSLYIKWKNMDRWPSTTMRGVYNMRVFTWGIKQHHIVSCVEASSLHEGRCDLLRSLVQLSTGGCAHRHPLQRKERKYSWTHTQQNGSPLVPLPKGKRKEIRHYVCVAIKSFPHLFTLLLSSTYRTWSGSVWALHCSASDKNWCW